MDYEVELVDLQEQPAALVRGEATPDGIADFLGTAFGTVMEALGRQGMAPAGAPFARYSMSDGGFHIEAGFPTEGSFHSTGDVVAGEVPGGHAARTVHHGAYDDLPAAYDAVGDWLTDNGFVRSGEPWESYVDEPDVPEPRTLVFFPCTTVRHG